MTLGIKTRIEMDQDHNPASIILRGETTQTFLGITNEVDRTTLTCSIDQIKLKGSINKFRNHRKLNHLIAYMANNDVLIQSQAVTLKNLEYQMDYKYLCQVTQKIQGIWVRNIAKNGRTSEPKEVEIEEEPAEEKENKLTIEIPTLEKRNATYFQKMQKHFLRRVVQSKPKFHSLHILKYSSNISNNMTLNLG
ncbi:hypothetical protein EPI10_011524 [Gossypium australe]|uniref:Uncharacterized protein n=1 Tax=Gossypium australe TaxID=47621 RepID=A0A5B6W941_9ROSI|nr:hypothetical protein EPI10_011524 [Gossypium australe]